MFGLLSLHSAWMVKAVGPLKKVRLALVCRLSASDVLKVPV